MDTYREKGAENDAERAFQPQLTAMFAVGQTAVTKDDQEGIRAVWKALVLGVKFPHCGVGYKLHNVDGYYGVYCVFEKTNASPSNQGKISVDTSGGPPLFNCTEHFAMMGSWDGCLKYLRARAKVRGQSVNEQLDANDLLAAVDACVSSYPGQTTTYTKKNALVSDVAVGSRQLCLFCRPWRFRLFFTMQRSINLPAPDCGSLSHEYSKDFVCQQESNPSTQIQSQPTSVGDTLIKIGSSLNFARISIDIFRFLKIK